ncbi:hypothetical protein Q2T40_17125 [Winogradskyella maritima]|uniref:Uncharacterized protein n=1 Tax=Winogradskyella maritima TaxID=1517766 RepID=A0ABV8AEM9_9FLAO|nr:hypothetical protein [Winogradskyella maritima]
MIISKLLSLGGVVLKNKKARFLIGAAKLAILAYAIKKGEPEPELKVDPSADTKVRIDK